MSKVKGLITKVTRIYNRYYTMCVQRCCEREFTAENGQTLRYMKFASAKNNLLLIGFQACSDIGARYNYVSTVRSLGVNRLFIKDDFGADGRGDYYLGENGTYSVEKAVFELIDKMIADLKPSKIILFGSSKGAYAALNFGLRYPDSDIVIAAPQYYLADYLDTERNRGIISDILGGKNSAEECETLNRRLSKIIASDEFASKQRVFIHYSNQEHTYHEHISYMLTDIKQRGIALEEDIGDYKDHDSLKYYFPGFLTKTVRRIQAEISRQ